MSAVTHPRQRPRRAQVRPSSWWGRAWARALEETAYADADLRSGRSLARQGAVGQLTIDHQGQVAVLAAVSEGDETWTVQLLCERLPTSDQSLFTELVAAESGRVAGLLGGDLPHALVEDAEQAGVELLPYSGDLATTCGCAAWVDPCQHALAVGYQLGWLLDRDPFVLLQLRGVARDDLLAGVHALSSRPVGAAGSDLDSGDLDSDVGSAPGDDPDAEAGAEAVDRATRVLALLEEGKPFTHLF